MNKRIVLCILALVLLIFYVPRCVSAEPHCVSLQSLERTTIRIARVFQVRDENGLLTYASSNGTAWFVDPTHIVTVKHVVDALSIGDAWTPIEIHQVNTLRASGFHNEHIPMRVVGHIALQSSDDITVLELKRPFPGMQIASVRTTPLEPDEVILSVGFPRGSFLAVTGRYVGERVFDTGYAGIRREQRLHFSSNRSRIEMVAGASGSPVFDCDGRVAFVISHFTGVVNPALCRSIDAPCIGETAWYPQATTNLAVSATEVLTFLDFLKNPQEQIQD